MPVFVIYICQVLIESVVNLTDYLRAFILSHFHEIYFFLNLTVYTKGPISDPVENFIFLTLV